MSRSELSLLGARKILDVVVKSDCSSQQREFRDRYQGDVSEHSLEWQM